MNTKSFIKGIGKYLPEKVVFNDEIEKNLDIESGWIKEKTGIGQRHIAAQEESVSDMAAKAGFAALVNANLSPMDIDLIILTSSMPDMFFPSSACIVQHKIGAINAAAFDLSNACAGFIYAISTAVSFIAAKTFKNILVAASETMSRIVNWQDKKSCILFGDGAAAFVISSSGQYEILATYLGADGSGAEVLKLPGGGSRIPASYEMLERGENFLYMEGGEVFRFAKNIIGKSVEKVLEKISIPLSDISLIIPHQSNIRIIEEAAKIMNFPLEKFYINLYKRGNISSASIPIAMCEAEEERKIKENDTIVFVSYGSGLAYAACAIKKTQRNIWQCIK